jgi:lysozyme
MKTNRAGIDLIKDFEGLRLIAYQDSVGIWTIGYGHTGPEVHKGGSMTAAEAEQTLRQDLAIFEEGITRSLGGAETSENQFAAMVAMAYNIGLKAFRSSSVLRFHREHKPIEAANAFNLWNKAGGKVIDGLTRRRKAEGDLYRQEVTA